MKDIKKVETLIIELKKAGLHIEYRKLIHDFATHLNTDFITAHRRLWTEAVVNNKVEQTINLVRVAIQARFFLRKEA